MNIDEIFNYTKIFEVLYELIIWIYEFIWILYELYELYIIKISVWLKYKFYAVEISVNVVANRVFPTYGNRVRRRSLRSRPRSRRASIDWCISYWRTCTLSWGRTDGSSTRTWSYCSRQNHRRSCRCRRTIDTWRCTCDWHTGISWLCRTWSSLQNVKVTRLNFMIEGELVDASTE